MSVKFPGELKAAIKNIKDEQILNINLASPNKLSFACGIQLGSIEFIV